MQSPENDRRTDGGHSTSKKSPKSDANTEPARQARTGTARRAASARDGGPGAAEKPAGTSAQAKSRAKRPAEGRTTAEAPTRVPVPAAPAPGREAFPRVAATPCDAPGRPSDSSDAGPGAGCTRGLATARSSNLGLGRYGEEVAARRLTHDGLKILERNWRCSDGEIDIVALDGETLAVCEVKTRSERAFQHPTEGIDRTKAERLRRLAERWLSERWPVHFERLARTVADALPGPVRPDAPAPAPPGGVRIDLIAVVNRFKGAALVEHLRGAV